MKSMTISEVSKNFGISTRMLRYYEQEGIIKSYRKEGYAYRIYDEHTTQRIQQILILRKLRIPLRQIKVILENKNAVTTVDVFLKNVKEMDEEITALSTIKDILSSFIEELVKTTALPLHNILTEDDGISAALESLDIVSINFKDEQINKANQQLSKLNDVRILYLPPLTVASAHVIGDEPEQQVNQMLDTFVREHQLHIRKPDLRHFGFNHPNPVDETGYHGYEAWVSIPKDMEVTPPLTKKQFPGGLYGAHMITLGNFNAWDDLLTWANTNDTYEFAGDIQDQEHMCGLLEEHLNYYHHITSSNVAIHDIQLDLLIPIRPKEKK